MKDYEKEYQNLLNNITTKEMDDFIVDVVKLWNGSDIPLKKVIRQVVEDKINKNKINDLIINNRKKIIKLKNEIAPNIYNPKNMIEKVNVLQYALEGKITSNIIGTIYDDNEIIRKLVELSRLVRENYYLFYKYTSNEVLIEENRELVSCLQSLLNDAQENYPVFDSRDLWSKEEQETSLESELLQIQNSDIDKLKAGAGDFFDEQPESLFDENVYSETSFDNLYSLLLAIIHPLSGKVCTKKRYIEAMDLLWSQYINVRFFINLSNFYREYCLKRPNFSEEEIKSFESDINNCLGYEEEKGKNK